MFTNNFRFLFFNFNIFAELKFIFWSFYFRQKNTLGIFLLFLYKTKCVFHKHHILKFTLPKA
jgi:hypothetical protein